MNMKATIDTDISVRELIGLLAQLPGDAEVTIANNGWQLLYDIEEDTLVDELPWKKD